MLLLGFSYVIRKKEHWALCFIMVAAFLKLYGLIGLVFILFSQHKLKFTAWALIRSAIFFLSPLLLTDFEFLVRTYSDWKTGLLAKAAKNIRLDNHNYYQDISLSGMIRRALYPGLRDAMMLTVGSLLYLSQFLYNAYSRDIRYRIYILCSSLIFLVIFSSGAESPTYIIAAPALCLWFFMQPRSRIGLWVFAAAFLFTTFSYSDLLTPWFRNHIVMLYSLKAFPSFVIRMIMLVQIHRRQFLKKVDISRW